jgi:PHP domain
MITRIERRVTPEDRAASPYLEVPFEVPSGVGSVGVHLRYDRAAGVVDLGCVGSAGFRGWSGGARDRFAITPDAATPGYVAGELEEGGWSVLLGLHRIPGGGLDLALDISLPVSAPPDAEPPAPPTPRRRPGRELPAAPGLRWLACDLHAHTVHSDGSLGVAELAAAAVRAGLDVLAVTDHNTVSHHALLPQTGSRYGVTLIAGQEVTTDRGHANALGDIGWVDFRQPAHTWVSAVAAAGGVLSINHPLAADCSWHHPLTERPPLAEIWHWTWLDRRWTGRRPGVTTPSRSAAAIFTIRPRDDIWVPPSPGSPVRPTSRPPYWTACAPAVPRWRPASTSRCCCGWTTSSSPSVRTGPC